MIREFLGILFWGTLAAIKVAFGLFALGFFLVLALLFLYLLAGGQTV